MLHRPIRSKSSRAGKILVLFVLLLTVLLGMVGLVIDGGLLMGTHRGAQNAADSAAMFTATELMRGETPASARTLATTFLQDRYGIPAADVTINIPPATGPHTGDLRYAEAIIQRPYDTYFVHVVGTEQSREVSARAVAGYEALAEGEGAIVLDPDARPGLGVQGGATLSVDGAVIVNSRAAGIDQYGAPVDWGLQEYALSASNNALIEAKYIQVRGGVDELDNYQNIDPDGEYPLFARASIAPDPLRELPVPTGSNGVDLTQRGAVSFNNSSPKPSYLDPGIYSDIRIANNAEVIFNPGIYILSPTKPNQGLVISGSPTISGAGVMFYLTGSNYLSVSGAGHWDIEDDAQNDQLDGPLPPTPAGPLPPPPDPQFNKVDFATLDVNANAATINFTGLNDPSSPFNRILFFQRRRNMEDAQIQGNAGTNVLLGGTIYAKWANFKVSGEGRYDAQFVVGSMAVSGGARVTINGTGDNFGLANQVFLVE